MKQKKLKISEIQKGLEKTGYISNKYIEFAISSAINNNNPLLIEGAPGTGKTSIAYATAKMLNVPLLRVQFYEGITADKILYDYDYQRQLLTIESIKSSLDKQLKGKNIQEAIDYVKEIDFYGEEFLIKRPVLQSLMSKERVVLLLDEIDKASEEIEYALLEVLDTFSMSIPQYGTIENIDNKPIVFLTSNNYRDLSDALKRRCSYLYIDSKTVEENTRIILNKTKIDEDLAKTVAEVITKLQKSKLKQTPSIAEGIVWAEALNELDDLNDVKYTLHLLSKNKSDRKTISQMLSEAFKKDL